MIFVDTNVFMYAVGRPHPLQRNARDFFSKALDDPSIRLYTSAEVLQELLHVYLPVERLATLDAAFQLAESCMDEIWAVEAEDVGLARSLVDTLPGLIARDLLHLACCRRRKVTRVKTYDRALQAAFH